MNHHHESTRPYAALKEQKAARFLMGPRDPEHGFETWRQEEYTKPIEQVEADLVADTDALIGVLDGTLIESDDHFLEQHRRFEGPVDGAIYLDKSSRPVRALVNELWTELSDEKPVPASFLNIDKEPWLYAMGYSRKDFTGRYIDPAELSLDKIDPDFLALEAARIRALYLKEGVDLSYVEQLLDDIEHHVKPTEALDEIWQMPTILDDKHVAIVDEVKSTKATLTIADMLLQRAFPETRFEPAFWSTPPVRLYDFYDKGTDSYITKQADSERPLWYDSSTSDGRGGIENRSIEESARSNSRMQRIGKSILSTSYSRHHGAPDTLGMDFRADFKLLADRFKAGEINYKPNPNREFDDFKQRIEEYYHTSFKEWTRARKTTNRGAS